MKTLILTWEDVRTVLDMNAGLEAVETALGAHGRAETLMPPKVYLPLDQYSGDFRAMPAYLNGSAGVKWVNSHPNNDTQYGLPTVMGLYILSDPASAAPLAVMDATFLTAVRTGAAAGVASKHLAPSSPRTLGLVGCGVQAAVLLEAHRATFTDLRVLVTDLSADRASRFAQTHDATPTTPQKVCEADIICTSTPSRQPIVERDWVGTNTHINAMGADGHGKQELDPAILKDARLFVDDLEQATNSGEVNVPLSTGQLSPEDIAGTLGQVIAGITPGRQGEGLTVFDSTGLAVQDVAVARIAYEAALERGVGLQIDFLS